MFFTENQLLERLSAAADPYEDFAQLARGGLPLVDPASTAMTFLVNTQELGSALPDEPVTDVHLWINRLTDKHHHALGQMVQVPGTSLWVRTVDIPPTLRAAYCFRLNAGQHRPPGHNNYPHARDPHARNGAVVDNGDCGLSLLLGARENQPSVFEGIDRTAAARYEQFDHDGQHYLFYCPVIPYRGLPLLELIDADMWFGRQRLDLVLDKEIAAGTLPPLAVIGPGFSDSAARNARLRLDPGFLTTLHTVLPQLAAQRAARRGQELSHLPPVLAGQSLGALTALYAAMQWPERFSAVVAHSPSLWWNPAPGASPRDLTTHITPWLITQLYAKPAGYFAQLPPAFVEAGLREDQLLPHCLDLARALQDCGWRSQYRTVDGGHDVAWWRESLITNLAQALRPFPTPRLDLPSL